MAVVLSFMYLSGGVFIVVLSDYIAETKNILKGDNNIINGYFIVLGVWFFIDAPYYKFGGSFSY